MSRPAVSAYILAPLCAALALLACGGDEPRVLTNADAPFVPVLHTTDLRVGDDRIVLSLLDRSEEPRFAPDADFHARLFEPTEGGIRYRAELELERVEYEDRAYYIARGAPLDHAGDWAIAVTVSRPDGASQSSPRVGFPVRPIGERPQIGGDAPNLPSPTLSDAAIEQLTAAPNPLPLLYQRSVAELLAAKQPFLLLFATPQRCGGQPTCRRALAQAEQIASDGTLAVIHIEPFGRPREAPLQAQIDALNQAWQIQSEPQFWLINANGKITARVTIAASDDELAKAINASRSTSTTPAQ